MFALLVEHWQALNSESLYLIDSFPIARCDTIRSTRSRRDRGEAYHGYLASKRRYFYGRRLHLVSTPTGAPVELFVRPGADNDTGALPWYQFDLPAGATIVGDNTFSVYASADDLHALGMALRPLRKKSSKRAVPAWETYLRELWFRAPCQEEFVLGSEVTRADASVRVVYQLLGNNWPVPT